MKCAKNGPFFVKREPFWRKNGKNCENWMILREMVHKHRIKRIWVGFSVLVGNFRCVKMSYFFGFWAEIAQMVENLVGPNHVFYILLTCTACLHLPPRVLGLETETSVAFNCLMNHCWLSCHMMG